MPWEQYMSRLQFVPRYLFASTFNFLTGKPMNSSSNARSALKACQSALLLPLLFVLLPAGAQAQATFGLQPVGIASGSQNVTVTASAAGTVANIEVLTTGAPGLDFTAAAAGASADPIWSRASHVLRGELGDDAFGSIAERQPLEHRIESALEFGTRRNHR